MPESLLWNVAGVSSSRTCFMRNYSTPISAAAITLLTAITVNAIVNYSIHGALFHARGIFGHLILFLFLAEVAENAEVFYSGGHGVTALPRQTIIWVGIKYFGGSPIFGICKINAF